MPKDYNKIFINDLTYFDLFNYAHTLHELFANLKEDTICINSNDPFSVLSSLIAASACKKEIAILSHLESKNILTRYTDNLSENVFFDLSLHPFKRDHKKTLSLNNENLKIIIFSSGTSGTLKGYLHNYQTIKSHVDIFTNFFKVHHSEKFLINLPLHHISGLIILFRAFFNNATLVTSLDGLPHYVSLVPTQFLKHLDSFHDLEILSKAKAILLGGQSTSKSLLSRAIDNNLKNIFTTYGMTETCSFIALNGDKTLDIEIKIDLDGSILVKSPTLALGYYHQKKFFPLKREDHFYKTSDIGEFENNKLNIKYRNDLIINSGGEKINPIEIEHALKEKFILDDFCLTSINDEKWGKMAVLLYKNQEDINPKILTFLKENFHPYHIPKFIFKIEKINHSGIKLNRAEMQMTAENEYLKAIFSHHFINNHSSITLVIFHGFMENKNDFNFIPDSLLNRYNYLLIDLPGHGLTSSAHFHSTSDLFFKLKKFIELYQRNTTLHLFGYSMGGRVATNLALFYSLRIEKLFLVSSGIGEKNIEEQHLRKLSDQNLFNNINSIEDYEHFLNSWYENPIFADFNKKNHYKEIIQNKLTNNSINELKKSLELMSPSNYPIETDYLSQFENIKFKVTYLSGGKDKKYTKIGQILKDLNSAYIKVISLEHEAHNPHIYSKEHVIKAMFSDNYIPE